jgi:DNA-binding LytR/AlgR family response regulator
MKVIIVDDEPKAISLIASYLTHFSNFDLIGRFRNGLKALEFINSNTVDVIFLDINMPHLNGLSLSKMLPKETAIIFTTAYSEYAVESYTINAVDYLLKPISLERFTKSITKLLENTKRVSKEKTIGKNEKTRLFIKSGLDTYQIKIKDILYLKKDGNYMDYMLSDKKIMARETIKEALEKLPNNFVQIHKSYIVNTLKINKINSDSVFLNQTEIPVGSQYKTHFLKRFNKA